MKITSCVVVLLVSSSAIAGSVVKLESRDYNANPPTLGSVEVSVEGNALRLEGSTPGTNETGALIYKSDLDEMIVIDHQSRQYFVIDKESLQQLIGQISDARKQIEAALAGLPPERRAMAESMMKQRLDQAKQPVELQTLDKTGERASVNGYECDVYNVMEGGRKTRDLCVAPWASMDGGNGLAKVMVAMADFFENMRKGFSQGGTDLMGSGSEVFLHMRDVQGFPVRSRDYDASGKLIGESVLVSSEARDLDSTLFALPVGYQQKSLN